MYDRYVPKSLHNAHGEVRYTRVQMILKINIHNTHCTTLQCTHAHTIMPSNTVAMQLSIWVDTEQASLMTLVR